MVVLSLARISPRSTAPPPMLVVGSPSQLLPQASLAVPLSSSRTPSVSPSLCPSMSTPMAPQRRTPLSWSRSSVPTLTSVLVSLSRSLTWLSPSTSRRPRTATLVPTRALPGSSRRLSSSKSRYQRCRRFNFSCRRDSCLSLWRFIFSYFGHDHGIIGVRFSTNLGRRLDIYPP